MTPRSAAAKRIETAAPPAAGLTFAPEWHQLSSLERRGFREVWRVKVVHPGGDKALWLRFSILSSSNGFRRLAEIWAIYFSRSESGEVEKTALKRSYDVSELRNPSNGSDQGLRIGDCELTSSHTRGSIQAKGRSIEWDFNFASAQEASFNWIPDGFSRFHTRTGKAETLAEDLKFIGKARIDGKEVEWTGAPGAVSHHAGSRYWNSWVWAHCNVFENEQGEPVYALFEGVSAKERMWGLLPSPRMSSFYFFYKGKHYRLNSLWDSLRSRSRHDLSQWRFQADAGDLSFRGEVTAENRDFAGFTYEDTNGSLLYCSNAELAQLTLSVYRRGKLETTLKSRNSCGFEVVSRQRNPYVPTLI